MAPRIQVLFQVFAWIGAAAGALMLAACATSRPDLAWAPGHVQHGKASWYAEGFHGKRTSNGEIYNCHSMTAAHPSLPLNTIVEVTSDRTGRSVLVRINDRLPPNNKGRIIDLSECAADRLDMRVTGVEPVTLRVVEFGNNRYRRINAAAPDGKMYLALPATARRSP